MSKSRCYFASDFHLGAPNHKASREREDKIVRWLDSIKDDAAAIYLLGDLFDFWHEYDTVVPKGFVRFQGKLAELRDSGIDIQIYTGNHDLWMREYFQEEFNIEVHKNAQAVRLLGKQLFIGHGDGLGPGDGFYKFLRKMFHNGLFKFIFKWVHPDIGMRIAHLWSRSSRSNSQDELFQGEDKEYLLQFCKSELQKNHYDFFIFGHRHLPLDIKLNEEGSRYINLGEWFGHCRYAVFDGENMELRTFTD